MEHPPFSKFEDNRPYLAPPPLTAINESADKHWDSVNLALPWERRCENVLADTFCGIHHIDKHRIKEDDAVRRWEYNHCGDMATYDGDSLTRFVLACHKWCVRGSIASSGPRHIRIILHPRFKRDGDHCWERHPTIEDAIIEHEGDER